MIERRDHPRHRTLKAGKIEFNRRLNVIDCIIRNVSYGGACLQIDSPDWLPDNFDLSIPIDGVKRACRVAWKGANRIGVAFLDGERRSQAA